MALSLARSLRHALDEAVSLSPQGDGWPRDPRSKWVRLLGGVSDWRARVDVRADDLLRESDPRTTIELLEEWEEAVGLPDDCLPDASSFADRRALVVSRIVGQGGARPADFVALAAALGITATVRERVGTPFVVGDHGCDDPVGDGGEELAWEFGSPQFAVRPFEVGVNGAGDSLGDFGGELLQCIIRRATPAHTLVVFVVNQVCYVALLDEFGELVQVALAEEALELVDELSGTMAVELIDGESIEVLDEGGEAMLVELTCPGGSESGGEEEGGDGP